MGNWSSPPEKSPDWVGSHLDQLTEKRGGGQSGGHALFPTSCQITAVCQRDWRVKQGWPRPRRRHSGPDRDPLHQHHHPTTRQVGRPDVYGVMMSPAVGSVDFIPQIPSYLLWKWDIYNTIFYLLYLWLGRCSRTRLDHLNRLFIKKSPSSHLAL